MRCMVKISINYILLSLEEFTGNTDNQNYATADFGADGFITRYVRITVTQYHGQGCLRVEFLGCESGKFTDLVEV